MKKTLEEQLKDLEENFSKRYEIREIRNVNNFGFVTPRRNLKRHLRHRDFPPSRHLEAKNE